MIADYTLLILSCLFAYCTRKFMIGLLFIIGLVVFEMISAGGVRSGNCWFLVVSIFGMLLMVKEDTTLKGDESLLLRYNPYYMKNKLPPWLRGLVLGVFLIAYMVRFVVVVLKW